MEANVLEGLDSQELKYSFHDYAEEILGVDFLEDWIAT